MPDSGNDHIMSVNFANVIFGCSESVKSAAILKRKKKNKLKSYQVTKKLHKFV